MDSSLKRFLALLLAASMVFSVMATTVSATESTSEATDSDISVEPVLPSAPAVTEPAATEPSATEAVTVPSGTEPATEAATEATTETTIEKTIDRIEVQPLTLYQWTGGEWVTTSTTTYYRYNWQNEAKMVIYFTDGTSETLRKIPVGTFTQCGIEWKITASSSSQGPNKQWLPGSTNSVTVTLRNVTTGETFKATSTVAIAETAPLVSLSVEPVTIYDGQYLVPGENGTWHYDFSRLIRFRAEFFDGTVIEETDNSFWYDGERYFFNVVHDSTSANPWQPGVHYAEISVMGQKVQLEVTILESPVADISFNSLYIIENQLGGICEPVDGEPYYNYEWKNNLGFTVFFTDGTAETYHQTNGFSYNDQWFEFYTADDQETTHWQAGDSFYEYVSVLNKSYPVYVNIIENPVDYVEISPITVHTGVDDFIEYDEIHHEDGSYEEVVYQRYFWSGKLFWQVHFKDGEQVTATNAGVRYRDVNYPVYEADDQSYENEWQSGNTYQASVTLLGNTYEVPVTVAGSPVKEVVFQPISIVENTGGWPDGDYYHYEWWNRLQHTVYFYEGDPVTGSGSSFLYNDCYNGFDFEDPQDWGEHWTVGNTYYVDVEAMGVKGTVAITIQESPLQSFSVQPITLIENTSGSWEERYNPETDENEQFYRYYWWDYMQTSAQFADVGTVSGGGTSIYYNDQWYNISHNDDQYNTPWEVGKTYYQEVSLMGKTTTVEISVVESPLQSITLTPITMLECTSGWDAGGYYHYDFSCHTKATLVFTDDTVVVENINDGYYYKGQHYGLIMGSDQGPDSPWKPGTVGTAWVEAMGIRATAPVTIEPFAVQSLTMEPILLQENSDGWWSSYCNEYGEWISYFYYDWPYRMQFTVTMENGDVISGSGTGFSYRGNWFELQYSNPQGQDNQWYGGNTYEIPVSIDGVSTNLYVQIVTTGNENGFEYMVQNGMAFITNAWRSDETLYIPETLGGYPVKGIQDLGWEAREWVAHLYIPDCVTMLGESLFASGEIGWRNLRSVSFGNAISSLRMDMFVGCKQLEAVDVAKDNEYYYSEDGVVYTKDMTEVVIFPLAKTGTYYLPDSVQNANAIFDNLGELKATIEFEKVDGYVKENGVVYNEDKTVVIAVDAGLTGSYVMPDSVTEIKRFAFKGSNLSHVTVSKNVTSIVYYSFYESNIQSVSLPDSITAIESGAFEDCAALTDINIPANLERLGSKAFANSGITSAKIPGSVHTIAYKAFYNSDLEELELCEGVQEIQYLAFTNTKIKNLVIPDSVTYMDDAFNGCHELRSLTVGDGLDQIGGFWGCYQLTEVHLGDNVNHIQMHAFRDCPITELTLGDNVWHVFGFAFDGADLETIELPDTVTYIAYRAFGGNTRLQQISLPRDLTRLSYKAFEDTGWYNAQPEGHVYLDGFYYNYKGQLPADAVLYLDENTRGVADELQMDHDLSAVIFQGDAPAHLQLSNMTVVYPADNATWDEVDYSGYGYNLTWIAAKATGQCGENAYWVLDEEGCLHILGSGAMADYSYGSAPWYSYRDEIKSVKVTAPITYVGSYAFVFLQDVNVYFEADAPAFGDNCFAGTTGTINYPTGCENWDTVLGSQFGGSVNWDDMDDLYASDECGENMSWTLDISGTLTITGTGYMDHGDWKYFSDRVKRVVIQEGVQSIADNAFSEMYSLEKVTIAASVEYIGCHTFLNCIALKQVCIADNSVMYRIGANSFRYCCALESINLPQRLERIEYGVFYGCTSLTEVQLPDSLYAVEDEAFYGCAALESVVIPNGVTELGYAAFKDCISLSYVQLPQSIHELAYETFRNCINLKSIELPSELTSLAGTFWRSSVESITIPASLEYLGHSAFRNCQELKEITFLGSKPNIADNAFHNVTATVYYNGDDESWNGIENEYYGGNLTWVPVFNYVDEGQCGESLTWHLKQDGTLVIKGTGQMYNYGACSAPWYDYADQIIDLEMDGVTYVGDHAFYGLTELRRISAESLTHIGFGSFGKCTSLWSFGLDNLQSIDQYAFAECSQLQSFRFNESLESIGAFAFLGCSALESVVMEGAPNVGEYAFQGCINMVYADLGSMTEISDGMFAGCINLGLVEMGTEMTRIGNEAFLHCIELDAMDLGKNVTYIGDFAFQGCTDLHELQIPEKVTYVGSFALHNCEHLSQVIFLGDAPEFGYQPMSNLDAQLVYFENTNGWSEELIASLGGNISADAQTKTYVIIFRNGSYMTAYETMEAALVDYNATTDYLQVSYGLEVDITLTQDLYLDLNGNDVSGVIRTNGNRVILVDSATDNYSADAMGYLNCTDENGQTVKPEKVVYMTEERYGRIARYMAIETEYGWTSHRFYMGITHTSLKPAVVGMGYKSVFYGDEMVIAQLDAIGYMLQIEGGVKRTFTKRFEDMYSGKEVSLRINNWDIPNHGETQLYAQVCLQLSDGTVVESATYATTMRRAVENMNAKLTDNPDAYTDQQIKAVQDMLKPYLDELKDWVVDAIRDRVTAVDPMLFNPNMEYARYTTSTTERPDGSGEMDCLWRTYLNPAKNMMWSITYSAEPWGENPASITYNGRTWYEFAGGGDSAYWEINEHYIDFFLDTDARELIRCQLLSDGNLQVVYTEAWFKAGDILQAEALPPELQMGSYQGPVIGSFGYDDYYYEESICIHHLSFDVNGIGGVWLGDIYLPDTNWADDPNDSDILTMIYDDRVWYKWNGGGLGDDTTYFVSDTTVTIYVCGDPETQIICELLPDGNLQVVSADIYMKPGSILYYEG